MLGPQIVCHLSGHVDRRDPSEDVLTRQYDTNYWADDQSVSGPGSTELETQFVREALPRILQEQGIASLLDAPCSDFS